MAAAGPAPILTLLCLNYRPELTTDALAEAYLDANPTINGVLRPSWDNNGFTLTRRYAHGGFDHASLRVFDPMSLNVTTVLRANLPAAPAGPVPMLTLLCLNYRPELTTDALAEAYLDANPTINGVLRPSWDNNEFTLTRRYAYGGFDHRRLRVVDNMSMDVTTVLRARLPAPAAVPANLPAAPAAVPAPPNEEPSATVPVYPSASSARRRRNTRRRNTRRRTTRRRRATH